MTRRSRHSGPLFALLALVVLVAACDWSALDVPSPSPSLSTAPTASPSPSFVRPTPTPLPTFLSYVVAAGDSLTSIASEFGTSAQSLAYWNRAAYPSLDPESNAYDPNTIKVGWTLILLPFAEVDPEDLPPPAATPSPAGSAAPSPPTIPSPGG